MSLKGIKKKMTAEDGRVDIFVMHQIDFFTISPQYKNANIANFV